MILILAVAVAIGLSPFFSGLLGAAVLYVIWARPYQWLERALKPGIAAALVLVSALLLIALPATWLIGLLIDQAPDALRRAQTSDVFSRIAEMRVGSFQVGPELAKATDSLLSWLSSQLAGFVGGATSLVLNFVIAFFGLYYLLRSGPQMWAAARSYIPFSASTSDALLNRFVGVTEATLLGTALVAVAQGTAGRHGVLARRSPQSALLGHGDRVRVGAAGAGQRSRLGTCCDHASRTGESRCGSDDARHRGRDCEQRGQSHSAAGVQAGVEHSSDDHARRRLRRR
jgi:predicted PurR-regulated permease PerM